MKVLYITGVRHCGSTMLEAILGAAPRVTSLGEVWGFFRYETCGFACACGEKAAGCESCLKTRAELDADDRARDLDLLMRSARGAGRLGWLRRRDDPGRASYAAACDDLFEAAARATDAELVIDSSKNVARLASLGADSRNDVYALHLIRDARGSLRSEERNAAYFGTMPAPRKALFDWFVKNSLMDRTCRTLFPADRRLRVHYEDLVTAPNETLERIGAFVGIDATGLAALAMTAGVPREHLYEPHRYADYRVTKLDPRRIEDQRLDPATNDEFWRKGGFLVKRFGYDKDQSYLPAVADRTPA